MTEIILFGCGALGSRLLRAIENDYPALNVVGAVDHAPGLSGQTLATACNSSRFGTVQVMPDLASCLAGLQKPPSTLVHMTESKPERIEAQLMMALDAGLNVVSAAESMFYPSLRYPGFADRLDLKAREMGVTVTGMGINPGFSYDTIPLLLARATSNVHSVTIRRCIDVTGTGPGDIEHVGYGLTPEAFREGVARGSIVGHMGAPESLALMAEYLDMELDTVTERWDLETAEVEIDSGDPTLGILPPGRVVGITQFAEGFASGKRVLQTQLAMYYQPERFGLVESDQVEIEGNVPVRMTIEPALQSLFGAANVLASAIIPATEAAPGLQNCLGLPVVSRRSNRRYILDPDRELEPGKVPLAAARE